MAGKNPDSPEHDVEIPAAPVKRLCNEIQLFDLCDLERCSHKDGRFCTDTGLLTRFEKIADEEVRRPSSGHVTDDPDEEGEEWGDDEGFDDAFDDDGFGDEGFEEDE